jgi:hypothetical protein
MATNDLLRCDGCGQPASPEHIAKRLKRLEWTTRFRPVHIGTLFLGGAAPSKEAEFLYTEDGPFAGQARHILGAAGVSADGKSKEATLAEFQRGGLMLTYVLECPFDPDEGELRNVLATRLPALTARIRRSLRPKRLVPISRLLQPLVSDLQGSALGCALVLDGNEPFDLDGDTPDSPIDRLRQILASASAPAR